MIRLRGPLARPYATRLLTTLSNFSLHCTTGRTGVIAVWTSDYATRLLSVRDALKTLPSIAYSTFCRKMVALPMVRVESAGGHGHRGGPWASPASNSGDVIGLGSGDWVRVGCSVGARLR